MQTTRDGALWRAWTMIRRRFSSLSPTQRLFSSGPLTTWTAAGRRDGVVGIHGTWHLELAVQYQNGPVQSAYTTRDPGRHGVALAGEGSWLNVALAWTYVGLRVVHSLWQTTVNIIPLRMLLFTSSSLVLVALSINAVRATLFGHLLKGRRGPMVSG